MRKVHIALMGTSILLVLLISFMLLVMGYKSSRASTVTSPPQNRPYSLINKQPVFQKELANISESDQRDLIALTFVMLRLQLRTEAWYLTLNYGTNHNVIFNIKEIDTAVVLINLSPDTYKNEVELINRLYSLHNELFKLYSYPSKNRMEGLQNLAYYDIIESIERDAEQYPFLYEYWNFLSPIENHESELVELQIQFEETFANMNVQNQENLFLSTFRELYYDTANMLAYYDDGGAFIGNGKNWFDLLAKWDSNIGRTLAYQLGHLSPDRFDNYKDASALINKLLDQNTKLRNLYFSGIRHIDDIEMLEYTFTLYDIREESLKHPFLDGSGLFLDSTFIQNSAVRAAESYLANGAFSRQGLIGQLESEGFSYDVALYAVDHSNANWKEQAVKFAQGYWGTNASKKWLVERLEYEGFSYEQALYGVDTAGW